MKHRSRRSRSRAQKNVSVKKQPSSSKSRGKKGVRGKKFKPVIRKKRFTVREISGRLSLSQVVGLLTFISPPTRLQKLYHCTEKELKDAARMKARKVLREQ